MTSLNDIAARRRIRILSGNTTENDQMSKMKRAMEKKAEKQVEKLVEKQKLTLPATTYDNPWLEAAAEAGNPFGKLLKFVKGVWMIGDDEIAAAASTSLISISWREAGCGSRVVR